ncbi:MAG: hypothetical protein IJV00_09865 [Clostridia bacterium]|nr:hypothetical protein [Clostridia bacterium]
MEKHSDAAEFDIGRIDPNLAVKSRGGEDVVWFDLKEKPVELYGVMRSADGASYRRMPESLFESGSLAKNEGAKMMNERPAGGRARFSTDSPYIALKCTYSKLSDFPHMPPTGVSGFDLYCDTEDGSLFDLFFTTADLHGWTGFETEAKPVKNKGLRYWTLNFPLYNRLDEVWIGLKPGCGFGPGKKYSKPGYLLFYGSSITQGGCASRPGNAFTSMVSRWLDIDHVNLGFSGSGLAEVEMMEYIASLDPEIFIYDYDHNAPDLEHLENTHRRGFEIFRKKHPDTPVVFVSAPGWKWLGMKSVTRGGKEVKEAPYRRDVIWRTYAEAWDSGDRNVYFLDGNSFFASNERNDCTVDGSHPSDLGMYRIAEKLYDALVSIFRIREMNGQ